MSDQYSYHMGTSNTFIGLTMPFIGLIEVILGWCEPIAILYAGAIGVALIIWGRWQYNHPYYWWPTHAEDRVKAIQEWEKTQ